MTDNPTITKADEDLAHRIVTEWRPSGWPVKEQELARLLARHSASSGAAGSGDIEDVLNDAYVRGWDDHRGDQKFAQSWPRALTDLLKHPSLAALSEARSNGAGEDARASINRILGEVLGVYEPDVGKRIEIGNRVCTEILANLAPPTTETALDSLQRLGQEFEERLPGADEGER